MCRRSVGSMMERSLERGCLRPLRKNDLVKHRLARFHHAFDVGATHAAAIHAAELRAYLVECSWTLIQRTLQLVKADVVTDAAVDFET